MKYKIDTKTLPLLMTPCKLHFRYEILPLGGLRCVLVLRE